jgi:membrane-bound lytic murein transglycosylase F
LLPSTAKELGCEHPELPNAAITASTAYLSKLMRRYSNKDIALKDRVRFALAAYNAALARQEGLNANRWFGNVERAMLLLSKPRYYQKAKHGFARADETVRYVSEIQTRYDAYVALTSSAR